MRAFLSLCVIFMLVNGHRMLDNPPSIVEVAFLANDIVPDVLLCSPNQFVKTEFAGGVQAILGNILTLKEVNNQPVVSWPSSSLSYYTLAIVDPDATSRQNPNVSEVNHWLVGNIRGNNVTGGEVLASYFPPAAPPGTSFHRYIILIFKQKRKLTFTEARLLQPFSQKYGLGNAYAGNFLLAQFANEGCYSSCYTK